MRRKLKNFWMHPNENLCRSLDLFGQDVYHNRTMLSPRETMLGSNLCKRTLQRCLCTNLPQFRRYSEIDLCAPFARIRSPTLKGMAEKGIGKLLVTFPFCAETKQNGSELPIPSRLIRMRSMFQLKSHASSIKRIVRKIIKLILAIVLMLYC